ncbi:MAG: LytTR family transcriptional regulator DNA-binding domain-containing protein [Bacteroidales bacterium]|nr:LytTR family transcriptional regulator DNA-binding domain-containing protein [Bacteroidales bacterium]
MYIQAPGKIAIFAILSSQVERFLVISKGTEMLRVPASRLVYVSADGNYANVVTQDNKTQIVSFQLGQVEDMIGDQLGDEGGNFVRLGRGLIINTDFVYLIDIAKQRLILSDCLNCYHELTASREVLIKLKAYIDATINHG